MFERLEEIKIEIKSRLYCYLLNFFESDFKVTLNIKVYRFISLYIFLNDINELRKKFFWENEYTLSP